MKPFNHTPGRNDSHRLRAALIQRWLAKFGTKMLDHVPGGSEAPMTIVDADYDQQIIKIQNEYVTALNVVSSFFGELTAECWADYNLTKRWKLRLRAEARAEIESIHAQEKVVQDQLARDLRSAMRSTRDHRQDRMAFSGT